MQSLSQFFSYMNQTDFKYVVLRNWEGLPNHVETGEHSDLDLLVYDLDHFLELFPELERVYPAPRVQFKLHLDSGEYVQLDARHVGDSYYPDQFEENILKTREWNELGFYTPNPIHHRLGLVYHVVHHKNYNSYQKHIGDEPISAMFDALKKNPALSWVPPDDRSVGRFNPYQRGATAVVSSNGGHIDKKQYRFLSYKLIDNEERILKLLDNPHFPKLLSRTEDTLRVEHCGSNLTSENLPKDWKEQLSEIVALLGSNNVVHRDIRLDNLMVKEGVIKLLDFGWSRLVSEEEGKHPELLGYPNKCPLGFNDIYSMNRVIKQLENELDEQCH